MSRQVNTTTTRSPFPIRINEALGNTTSESFARSIDRTLRTVQRWRAGESEPRAADLILIATALGRHPAWFFSHIGAEQSDAVREEWTS